MSIQHTLKLVLYKKYQIAKLHIHLLLRSAYLFFQYLHRQLLVTALTLGCQLDLRFVFVCLPCVVEDLNLRHSSTI